MLSKVVLIVDKRKEQPVKYKKILESADTSVFYVNDFSQALKNLNCYEPDLIIISDSVDEDVSNTIKKMRILSYSSRPVIIILSKSDHIQDKIDALDAGADDFLSEPIDQAEFKARIGAHIRRHLENNINEKTGLYDSKVSLTILKRTIHENKKWAALLVDIDNFDFYKEIYGQLAADKMLQTYTAIIKSAVEENDYVGQIGNTDFLIVTNPLKAEKIAQYLIFGFNTVVEKFYSDNDIQRGYIITQGDERAGNKISLVSTSIGIISNEHKQYNSLREAVTTLISTHKLAKFKTGTAYVYESPKLSADDSIQLANYNNNILIIEPDEALSLLLYTTAQIQGYEPTVINEYSQLSNLDEGYRPAIIILDAGNTSDLEGISLCRDIKNNEKFKDSIVILSTTLHDKQQVLSAGADLYVPKPYELSTMFNWIEKFIKNYNE